MISYLINFCLRSVHVRVLILLNVQYIRLSIVDAVYFAEYSPSGFYNTGKLLYKQALLRKGI